MINIKEQIENSLISLEKLLGISITLIDHKGSFRTDSGDPLFTYDRQSHKKNSICKTGFCNKCPQHCRFDLEIESQKNKKPYIHTCWKGAMELVIPLFIKGNYVGNFYAGIWRSDSPCPINNKAIRAQYDQLPLIDNNKIFHLKNVLQYYTTGIMEKIGDDALHQLHSGSRKFNIMQFIQQHYTNNISLENLAKHLNLSVSRTSHVVIEEFDQPFKKLLIMERISAAKCLLQTTDLTISTVALQVGFKNEFHFFRTFNKLEKQTPGEYRKHYLPE